MKAAATSTCTDHKLRPIAYEGSLPQHRAPSDTGGAEKKTTIYRARGLTRLDRLERTRCVCLLPGPERLRTVRERSERGSTVESLRRIRQFALADFRF